MRRLDANNRLASTTSSRNRYPNTPAAGLSFSLDLPIKTAAFDDTEGLILPNLPS